MRKTATVVLISLAVCFMATGIFIESGACEDGKNPQEDMEKASSPEKKGPGPASCFDEICLLTAEKGGVKEITYEQFQKIRNSGQEYVLLDVLGKESYAKGHIPGAISFPYTTIDYETAPQFLKKTDKIIVYCGGFKCSASTNAANRLLALGYKNLLDFKGGLAEWQAKGNELVK